MPVRIEICCDFILLVRSLRCSIHDLYLDSKELVHKRLCVVEAIRESCDLQDVTKLCPADINGFLRWIRDGDAAEDLPAVVLGIPYDSMLKPDVLAIAFLRGLQVRSCNLHLIGSSRYRLDGDIRTARKVVCIIGLIKPCHLFLLSLFRE